MELFGGRLRVSVSTDQTPEARGDAKFGDAKQKATEFYDMGKLLWELGDFKSSIEKLESAAQYFTRAREHKLVIKCWTLC